MMYSPSNNAQSTDMHPQLLSKTQMFKTKTKTKTLMFKTKTKTKTLSYSDVQT